MYLNVPWPNISDGFQSPSQYKYLVATRKYVDRSTTQSIFDNSTCFSTWLLTCLAADFRRININLVR